MLLQKKKNVHRVNTNSHLKMAKIVNFMLCVFYNKKREEVELSLWCNRIGGVLGVLGREFDPQWAEWVKVPVLLQLWLSLHLQLRSNP